MPPAAYSLPTTGTWLKIMLWAVGLGTAAAVAATLFAPFSTVYRAAGTCFLLAGCALLMMLTSRLVDRERTRAAGLFGMGLIVVIFFLATGLIWEFGRLLAGVFGVPGWRFGEAMGMVIVWLLLTGLPSLVFLVLLRTEHSKPAGWTGLSLAGATFLLLVIGTADYALGIGGAGGDERWFLSGLWVGAMGALAVGCLAGSPGTPHRLWIWPGVLAAAAAASLGLYGTWTNIASPLGEKLTITFITAAAVVCYANLLLLFPVRAQHKWIAFGAVGVAVLTGSAITLLAFYEPIAPNGFIEFLTRAIVAGVIVSASAMLAMGILARMHRPLAIERISEQIHHIRIVCPVCHQKQDLPTGANARCAGCGLRIEIRVAEPRCPHCDYLLYHLNSPNCPECGQVINIATAGAAR